MAQYEVSLFSSITVSSIYESILNSSEKAIEEALNKNKLGLIGWSYKYKVIGPVIDSPKVWSKKNGLSYTISMVNEIPVSSVFRVHAEANTIDDIIKNRQLLGQNKWFYKNIDIGFYNATIKDEKIFYKQI